MVDEDDRTIISLEHALVELGAQCRRLADPSMGWWAWFDAVVACLLHAQAPGRPIEWTMLLCARRVTTEIRSAL